jgi:Mg-chelatase subunit ChlD
MNHDQLIAHAKKNNEERISIMDKKNRDYSKEEKAHSNFEMAATIASIIRGKQIDAEDVMAMLIANKLVRFENVNSKNGNHAVEDEDRRQTMLDLVNYLDIWDAYLVTTYVHYKEKTIK